jgi:hypothetical protein
MNPKRPQQNPRDSNTTEQPASRSHEYSQGKAHVSRPEEVERRATEKAVGRRGKPAPEGNTPGGVSS